MSTQALALAEVENTQDPLPGTVIEAIVLVTGQDSDLSFSSSSTAISIKDKDIILQPLSSAEQPVLYNLIFRAGEGVALFATPAVEFSKDDKNASLAINPDAFGMDFLLSFVNNLSPNDLSVSYDFTIAWIPSGEQLAPAVRRVITDPAIVLDPPNS